MHLSYKNVITNAKKIINMKSVTDFIFQELCELCLKNHQQAERSRVSKIKITIFLRRINVDIKIDFSTIARDNRIFILIKNDVYNMI